MEAAIPSSTTVIVLVARKPGLSFEHFKSYYEDKHIPWVTGLILSGESQPLSYTRHYIERDGDAPSFPFGGNKNFRYDCATQLVYRDVQHRDASLKGHAKYADEIAKDEETFLDRSTMKVLFVMDSVSSVAE